MAIVEELLVIKGEHLILSNQRAIYWESENALILSDVHIGKTTHFRKHGIPMPDDILRKDLKRLEHLIKHFNAKKLLIVGDLFHAEYNTDMDVFKQWLSQLNPLDIVLIKGNHDKLPQTLMAGFNFKVVTEEVIGPFSFVHDAAASISSENYQISGHMHPGITVKGKGKQRFKLPCYITTPNQMILPAFSLFTGLNTKNLPKHAKCYAFTAEGFFLFVK